MPGLERKKTDWPSVALSAIVSVIAIAIAWGAAQTTLAEDERRLNTLEQHDHDNTQLLIEVRNDVKWMRDRQEKKP